MSFFDKLTNAVTGLVRYATNSGAPYEVQEVKQQDVNRWPLIEKLSYVSLHKDGSTSIAVLQCPQITNKLYSLFKVSSDVEAARFFSTLGRLDPLCESSKRTMDEEILQHLCDAMRKYPHWSPAHLAAAVGLHECFRNPVIREQLNNVSEDNGTTPIMVGVQSGDLETVQELLVFGVDLNLADRQGDNVFHHGAKCKNPQIIQYLGSKDRTGINQLNLGGESALHTACLYDQPDNVDLLLRWGADGNLTMSGRYPIHCAMKVASARCAEVLLKWRKDLLSVQDSKYGGTPLHWAKTKECIYLLADSGCNLEATSLTGDTALHIQTGRNRLDCVMALLAKGANAGAVGNNGNNSLHLAVKTDNVDLVKALIVFGADVNGSNQDRETPRHLAANGVGKNREDLLYVLHKVGAFRCPPSGVNCQAGCLFGGTFDGKPPPKDVPTPPESPQKASRVLVEELTSAAVASHGSASKPGGGYRVLSLDGGGIRGLILIQVLLAIEKIVGRPIKSCFDWIGGTSTGGILALAIVHGKSLRYCQGLYLRLKDEVFIGKRPYPSEPLERFMKREFGETTRMSEAEHPKVLVTGVLGDRFPPELHFFRNYDPPGIDYNKLKAESQYLMPARPNEQFVWRAARSSGAAPTYFRAMGRFLDGGLMANNPTIDILTEIHEYNLGLKATGGGDGSRPMEIVVSIGTGQMPTKAVKSCDVYRPEGVFDLAKVAFGTAALGELLIEAATMSEGRPVDRARGMCGMLGVPFIRFSPRLSRDVGLDCTDNKDLIHMLWETQAYLYHHKQDELLQLATLLTP